MKNFIIRSTLAKPTFFENLGILKCKKKKSAQNCFEKYFFMGTAIDFGLINFCRVFSLQTTLMNVLQLRQKNFPYIQSTYIDVFFSAESIGTFSFAFRARFFGEKWNFSVLNAKKINKV